GGARGEAAGGGVVGPWGAGPRVPEANGFALDCALRIYKTHSMSDMDRVCGLFVDGIGARRGHLRYPVPAPGPHLRPPLPAPAAAARHDLRSRARPRGGRRPRRFGGVRQVRLAAPRAFFQAIDTGLGPFTQGKPLDPASLANVVLLAATRPRSRG